MFLKSLLILSFLIPTAKWSHGYRHSEKWRIQTINQKPCKSTDGREGICMFRWDCINRYGIMLSTCLDGFLFGACCYLQKNDTSNAVISIKTSSMQIPSYLESKFTSSATTQTKDATYTFSSNYLSVNIGLDEFLNYTENHSQTVSHNSILKSTIYEFFESTPIEIHPSSIIHSSGIFKSSIHSSMHPSSVSYSSEIFLLPIYSNNESFSGSIITPSSMYGSLSEFAVSTTTFPSIEFQTEVINFDEKESTSELILNLSLISEELATCLISPSKPLRVVGSSPFNLSPHFIEDSYLLTPSFSGNAQSNSIKSTYLHFASETVVLSEKTNVSPTFVESSQLTRYGSQPSSSMSVLSLSYNSEMVGESLIISSQNIVDFTQSRDNFSFNEHNTSYLSSTFVTVEDNLFPTTTSDFYSSEFEPNNILTSSSLRTTLRTTNITDLPNSTKLDYGKECGIKHLRPLGRIVGGKNTYFGQWPWQVLVKEEAWLGIHVKNKCGGVLINSDYVLTAAHCQPGFLASLLVILGEHDLKGDYELLKPITMKVKRMIVHREYNSQTLENDLALLELESAVEFQSHIVPICLPERGEDFTGQIAHVTGWGKLSHGGTLPTVLQEVRVPIISNSKCQQMFLAAGHIKAIRDTFVCAGYDSGGQDSCEGDSGGPLMVQQANERWVLVGTVSHGIRCADPNLPGVYMRTAAYRAWIDNIIKPDRRKRI